MPDEIEAERSRLIGQLLKVGWRIGMPTEEGQRARTEAMAEIQRKLYALPPKPYTRIGVEAGVVWIGSLLGSMPARPEPPEPDLHAHREYDPFDEASQDWRFGT
jgi:hypothetical protein